MKILATTNLIDFNTWYRYGYKSFSTGQIIILDKEKLMTNPYELFHKIGFFEEEGDIFFAEIEENIDDFKSSELFIVPINKIKSIIPFSEKGLKYLSNKLTDFKIEKPIPIEITKIILKQRNKYLAEKGGEMVLDSFLSDTKYTLSEIGLDIKPYLFEFIKAMDKYSENLNFEPETLCEYLIAYERSRPFPNTDEGFLYDVGSISKVYLGISDNELKIKDQLKDIDVDKYESIEELLSLSLFLQKKNEAVFSALIEEYKSSDWMKKLNKDISLLLDGSKNNTINNILILAFYLKFRYLVRNTSNVLDIHFSNEIRRFILKRPFESIIALYMNGLFFGFLKFRELYYLQNPLAFSKTTNSKKDKIKKIGLDEIIIALDSLSENDIKTKEEKNLTLKADVDRDSQDPSLQLKQIFIEAVTKAGEKGITFNEIQKIIKEKIKLDIDKKKVEALSESLGKFEKIKINNAKNINGIKIRK
jgi:hypothetical protein